MQCIVVCSDKHAKESCPTYGKEKGAGLLECVENSVGGILHANSPSLGDSLK